MAGYQLLEARCEDAENPRRAIARERSVSLLMRRFAKGDERAVERVRELEIEFGELGPFDAFTLHRLLRPRTAEERERRAKSEAAAGFDRLSPASQGRLLRVLARRASLRSRRPGVWGMPIPGEDPYLIAKPALVLGELASYLSDDGALAGVLAQRNGTAVQHRFAGGELVLVPSGSATTPRAVMEIAEDMAKGFQVGSRARHSGPRTLYVIERLDDLAVPLTASEADAICEQRRAVSIRRKRAPADRQAIAKAQLEHYLQFVRVEGGHSLGPNAVGMFPITVATAEAVGGDLLMRLLRLLASLEAFISALVAELRKRLGRDDLAAIADKFDSFDDALWLVTGFGPTFAAGATAGAARETGRMAGELVDTILDPVAAARAVTAALELFSSADGPDVARALGADVGAAEATKIAALARRNPVAFAYGLGVLVGPLLVQALLALAGAAAVAIASRFARTFRALRRTRIGVVAAAMQRRHVPEGLVRGAARAEHAAAEEARLIGGRGTATRGVAGDARLSERRGTAAPALADGRPSLARRLLDWLPARLPWTVEETARIMRSYRAFTEARPTMRGYVAHFDEGGRAIALTGTVRDALHGGGLPGRTPDSGVSFLVRVGSRRVPSPWGVDVFSGPDAHKQAVRLAGMLDELARQDREGLRRLLGIPDEWARGHVSDWSEIQIVAVTPSPPDTRLGLPSRGVAYLKGVIAPQHEHGTTWSGAGRELTTVPGGGPQVFLDPLAMQEGRLEVVQTIALPNIGHPDRAVSGTIEAGTRSPAP